MIKRFKKTIKPRIRVLGVNQKREVRNIVKSEIKKDTEYKSHRSGAANVGFNVAGSAQLFNLTAIAQGVLDDQRAGDEATLKSCHLRIMVRLPVLNNPGDSLAYVNARMMVFQYKSQDMTPTIGQLLDPAVANSGGGPGTFSARNIDYLNTYVVLWDHTCTLEQGFVNAVNFASSGKTICFKSVTIPLKFATKKMQYQATSTNQTNGLWLIVTADNDVGVNDPLVYYDCDISFTDS